MFDSRATTLELLDRPDPDPVLAADSYRFMELVNGHFGGLRVVRRFLAAETAGLPAGLPLRLVDIGSGSCDIPMALSQWGRAHGHPLHFTCLEMSGPAVDLARRKLLQAGDSTIHLLQEDAFLHQPAVPYDWAIASLCFHHFRDAQILALLQRLRGFVRYGVLINDLRRSRWASLAARLLLGATRAPDGVRHDALLSIRRGFTLDELRALLRQLDHVTVSVQPVCWFRIAALIRYQSGENP